MQYVGSTEVRREANFDDDYISSKVNCPLSDFTFTCC